MLEPIYAKLVLAYAGLYNRARREDGQALVEYALIITLIAVVAVAALKLTGTKITNVFNGIANDI